MIHLQGAPDEELLESLRDEGFARPTVLILVPTRKAAYGLVENLKVGETFTTNLQDLLFGEEGTRKAQVQNASRFEKEFGDNGYRIAGPRSENENFKVGILSV